MAELSLTCDAFLLAAGFGTRLRPLTDTIPKPLVQVWGKPLIEHHLERLAREGFNRIAINLHYLGDEIREFVGAGQKWGLEVYYSEEPVILNTGGGVKKLENWLKTDELLIINSDSLFDENLSLKSVLEEHRAKGAEMTLVARKMQTNEQFTPVWANGTRVTKLGGAGDEGSKALNYLGVMIIKSNLIGNFPGPDIPFSITSDVIPGLINAGKLVETVDFKNFWSDIGTPARLEAASKFSLIK